MITILCTAAVTCASAFAEPPQTTPPPENGRTDRVILVDARQMQSLPRPLIELRKMRDTFAAAVTDEDGFSRNVDKAFSEHVRQFLNDLKVVKDDQSSTADTTVYEKTVKSGKAMQAAPVFVKNLDDLKLSFSPVSVRSGELIGAAPHGPLVNGAWTGLSRYFRIEGSGYSLVSETDMAATDGMGFMIADAVNTTVAGKPATSVVYSTDQAQRVEEVLWVKGGKMYRVTYAPDQQTGRYGMIKTNSAVSALSLATELP